MADQDALAACLAPLRRSKWVVYAKRPFGGPEAVLAYLSRYTHRVAISNSRLIAMDHRGITFRWKDYRARGNAAGDKTAGAGWIKTMTLDPDEFIRRFLLHVLPPGFHRIRHTGFIASPNRASTIARIRGMIESGEIESGRAKPATEPAPAATINQDERPKLSNLGMILQPIPHAPAAAGACASSNASDAVPAPLARRRNQDRHIMTARSNRWNEIVREAPVRRRAARQPAPRVDQQAPCDPQLQRPIASQPRIDAARTASKPRVGTQGAHSATRRALPITKSP